MKKILVIMLIVVCSLSGISYAKVGSEETTLNYMGITLNIDNVNIVPKDVNGNVVEPFTIKGTTYLPVRAVSEALGKKVNWDNATKTVSIDDQDVEYDIKKFEGKAEGRNGAD